MYGWFVDDWDYRCNSDDSPELMNNTGFLSTLPPLVRDLMESADFFVVLGDYVDPNMIEDFRDPATGLFDLPPERVRELATLHNMPLKIIRRRNPEFQQHLLHEEIDGWEPEIEEYDPFFGLDPVKPDDEDALNHAQPLDESPPKATFDLVEDLRNDYSADFFPYPRDKSLKGYSKNLAQAITRGVHARALYCAIAEAKKRGVITGSQIGRLWELQKLQKYLTKK